MDKREEILGELLKRDLKDIDVLKDTFEVVRLVEKDNFKKAHKVNKLIKKITMEQCANNLLPIEKRIEFLSLQKKTLYFGAHYDFDSYMLYLEWDRPVEKQFYLPRRKQLLPVVNDLQDLEDKLIKFLGISLPPRTGKSTLGILFITWQMGKYPELANIMSGHSDPLTKGFYKEALSIIQDPQYKWSEIFSDRRILGTSADAEAIDIAEIADNRKTMRRFPTLTCRSVEGTLTGAVQSANVLYCDDLIKNLEEALSSDRKEAKYNAYLNQLKDRKLDNTKEIHIGTRWAVDDVIGKIKEQYEGNPEHRFRTIPALNENNESNFDYMYGVGFSTKYYLDMKESLGIAEWESKYMGEPYVREGLLFPKDELNYYNGNLPGDKPDMIIAACDVAWGGGDSLSMPIVYIYGESFFVHDVVFNKGDKFVTKPLVLGKLRYHKPHKTRFEANNGGDEYCDDIDRQLRESGFRMNLSHEKTPSDTRKMARIIQMAPDIKKLYFRNDKGAGYEYKAFMKELTTFVQMGKNKNDDAPDSLAMLFDVLGGGISIKIGKRTF